MIRFGAGGKLLLVLCGLIILAFATDRFLLRGRYLRQARSFVLHGPNAGGLELSTLDFPPGAAAPAGDFATLPERAIRVAASQRGSTATLLVAAGGVSPRKDAPAARAFNIQLELQLLPDEGSLAHALSLGGERPGGVDAAIVSVDRLPILRRRLRDARLKAVLLVSRSRGQEAIAAGSGIDSPAQLAGHRVAVARGSAARYFLYWSLARASVAPEAVQMVEAASPADAARLFREARADAAAGAAFDLVGPARERGGRIIASTADAPHLVATVLVARGEFLARYPDAVRRLARSLLDAADASAKDPGDAVRLLTTHLSSLGDPLDALRADPPMGLAENLAFFGVKGDAAVRYDELYASAAALWSKLGEPAESEPAADSRDLAPLLAASTAPPPAQPRAAPSAMSTILKQVLETRPTADAAADGPESAEPQPSPESP